MTFPHLYWKILLLLVLVLLPPPGQAADPPAETPAAAETAEAKDQSLDDISITAERMEMQLSGHTIELTGNILVQDKTMNLTADKMKVFMDEDNKLQRIDAEGNVTIRKLSGSESATGERGSYIAKTEQILLEGNCTLFQGRSIMNCEQIVYDRKNQSIIAKGKISLNIRDLKNRPGLPSVLGNNEGTPPEKTPGDSGATQNAPQNNSSATPSVQEKK
jgi:lipopolysaccharide transport protein LptA